ncbi:hypothetical protein DPX39_100092900 [Trypanosoma brucei equiperdum]|uniref:Uncharacterized protein n=1 Tax=Trypanosoma brucei equiperdum TaxID=630700 RepID=A0A3L6KYD1_9TRYP|nr:hypothetical protein DPX39_100092900 [Trypanosoma brucei equiperdum]
MEYMIKVRNEILVSTHNGPRFVGCGSFQPLSVLTSRADVVCGSNSRLSAPQYSNSVGN